MNIFTYLHICTIYINNSHLYVIVTAKNGSVINVRFIKDIESSQKGKPVHYSLVNEMQPGEEINAVAMAAAYWSQSTYHLVYLYFNIHSNSKKKLLLLPYKKGEN